MRARLAVSFGVQTSTATETTCPSTTRNLDKAGCGRVCSCRWLWPSLRRAALHGENFAMTPGEQIRDFMEVQAVAARFLESTKYNPTQGQLHIQNIGSGNPIALCKFAQFWWNNWNATGKLEIGKISYRNSEVMRYVPAI